MVVSDAWEMIFERCEGVVSSSISQLLDGIVTAGYSDAHPTPLRELALSPHYEDLRGGEAAMGMGRLGNGHFGRSDPASQNSGSRTWRTDSGWLAPAWCGRPLPWRLRRGRGGHRPRPIGTAPARTRGERGFPRSARCPRPDAEVERVNGLISSSLGSRLSTPLNVARPT